MIELGWAIQATRCMHLDQGDKEIYAVNLVMPCSGNSVVGGDGPRVALHEVRKQAGDLLYPWKWNTRWQVFAHHGGTWQMLGAPLELKAGVDTPAFLTDEVAGKVFSDLLDKGRDCPTPFSLATRWTDPGGGGARSLPHLLAPLTHWPAAFSNGALRLAGFIEIDKAALGRIPADAELACFPAFQLAGKAYQPGLPELVELPLPPDPQVPGAPPTFVKVLTARYDADANVVMTSQALARAGKGLDERSGSAELLPLRAVRDEAAEQLAPLAVLSTVVDWLIAEASSESASENMLKAVSSFGADVAMREQWIDALWAYLPTGWQAPAAPDDRERAHVLERVLPAEQAALLVPAPLRRERAAFERTLTYLTSNESNLHEWKRAREQYAALAGPFSGAPDRRLDEGLRFLGSWSVLAAALLAPDSGAQFAGPWYRELQPDQLAAGLPEAALRSAAVGEHMLRAAGLGLLSELGPLWDWIIQPERDNAAANIVKAVLASNPPMAGAPSLDTLLSPWRDKLDEIARRFLAILASNTSAATARAHDPGVPITFESSAPDTRFDEEVRGYAVALCACVPNAGATAWTADIDRAQWLTDTAVLYRDGAEPSWLTSTGDATWWMHETIGSTVYDGVRSTSVEYHGRPVAVMLADSAGHASDAGPDGDADGSDVIDFRWRDEEKRRLPLLGYGLAYAWRLTTIDNAGGVVDEELRSNYATLAPAATLFAEAVQPNHHYRSAVPPGAPVLKSDAIPASMFAHSADTKAHAYQALTGRAGGFPAQVALLAHDAQVDGMPLYVDEKLAPRKHTLRVAPPSASAEFLERWLNTDVLIRTLDLAGTSVSDTAFGKVDARTLAAFCKNQVAEVRGKGPGAGYHPAVGALGVAVWLDGSKTPHTECFEIERTRASGGALQLGVGRSIDLTIRADAARAASRIVREAGGMRMTIELRPGSFARLRIFSLVDERFFAVPGETVKASTDQRFHHGIALQPGDELPSFPGYQCFGPLEYWFEAAPAWSAMDNQIALTLHAPGTELHDGTPLAADVMALACKCDGSAAWIRSLYLQRHEWHWTGYPVDLPDTGAPLEHWMPSFSGVESYREAVEVVLDTGFDGADWRYGNAADGQLVLHRKPLQAGIRPARYAAYTARPVLRQRDLLNPRLAGGPLALESLVYAAGVLIPGRLPAAGSSDRLPVPPLRWAVPLTATQAPAACSDVDIERGANGNLLVFDDALRRTDSLTRLGGIGDIIEIDVLETHLANVNEIGANPIFHPNPKEDVRKQLCLTAHEPFGLTNDIASNALVTQTAMVVVPEGAQGMWIMAKVRARRLILPETLTGNLLAPREGEAGIRPLPLRIEGDTSVPIDFVLDLEEAESGALPLPQLRIGARTAGCLKELDSDMPGSAGREQHQPLRFLCSWHKGRWKGSEAPCWRLQVLAQQRDAEKLSWRTIGKLSPHENGSCELPPGRIEAATLSVTAAYKVRSISVSDYSDPIWLTFIGSFGVERLGQAEHYTLQGDGATLELVPCNAAPSPILAPEPADTRLPLLLLYRPLVDVLRGDRGDGSGALVGAYRYDRRAGKFVHLQFSDRAMPPDIAGCFGYVCTMQSISALSDNEAMELANVADFEGLISLMFPPPDAYGFAKESLVRLLPEYLGPITVGAK